MASIKFLVLGLKNNSPIYVRLSISRNRVYRVKSGLFINPEQWDINAGMPSVELPALRSELLNLESHLHSALNACSNAIELDSNWLQKELDLFHRSGLDDKFYLHDQFGLYIERLPRKESKLGGVVQPSTVKKYKTIQVKVSDFDKYVGKAHEVKDVDLRYHDNFKKFLLENQKLSYNTVGRYLKFVKTVVLDAKKHGLEVHSQIDQFFGFTSKPHKVVLTFDDLNCIKETRIKAERLILTRDWLLIGCYIGQRIGDLFSLTNENFIYDRGVRFLKVTQQKTRETVFIPLHPEVREVLKKYSDSLPPKYTSNLQSNCTLFNRYLKQLGYVAGLNTPFKGSVYNPKTGRREEGVYPHWMLLSSHVCRRSFASNFYGKEEYPTPLLMNITGHKSEAVFLDYIVNKSNDLSHKLAEIWK